MHENCELLREKVIYSEGKCDTLGYQNSGTEQHTNNLPTEPQICEKSKITAADVQKELKNVQKTITDKETEEKQEAQRNRR